MTDNERAKIEENIRQLEAAKSSGALPASVADASIAALKKELATYTANLEGDGAIAREPTPKPLARMARWLKAIMLPMVANWRNTITSPKKPPPPNCAPPT